MCVRCTIRARLREQLTLRRQQRRHNLTQRVWVRILARLGSTRCHPRSAFVVTPFAARGARSADPTITHRRIKRDDADSVSVGAFGGNHYDLGQHARCSPLLSQTHTIQVELFSPPTWKIVANSCKSESDTKQKIDPKGANSSTRLELDGRGRWAGADPPQ